MRFVTFLCGGDSQAVAPYTCLLLTAACQVQAILAVQPFKMAQNPGPTAAATPDTIEAQTATVPKGGRLRGR